MHHATKHNDWILDWIAYKGFYGRFNQFHWVFCRRLSWIHSKFSNYKSYNLFDRSNGWNGTHFRKKLIWGCMQITHFYGASFGIMNFHKKKNLSKFKFSWMKGYHHWLMRAEINMKNKYVILHPAVCSIQTVFVDKSAFFLPYNSYIYRIKAYFFGKRNSAGRPNGPYMFRIFDEFCIRAILRASSECENACVRMILPVHGPYIIFNYSKVNAELDAENIYNNLLLCENWKYQDFNLIYLLLLRWAYAHIFWTNIAFILSGSYLRL